MAATPFILSFAPRIIEAVLRMPLPERLVSGFYLLSNKVEPVKKEHLVIIGFGVNGRNVARAAEMAGIPYVIIEMNPETVRQEQAQGLPIYYGDATQEAVVRIANIREARIAVVAINDPAATRRIAEVVRRLGPKVHLIVRTRFLSEMKPLFDLGADEVIPEEFETSVEIFSRVLARYLIPRDDIESFVADIRSDGYEMFRGLSRDSTSLSPLKLDLSEVEISTFRITEDSSLAEETLGRIQLRKKHGISVLAIRRRSEIIYNPSADDRIEPGDILFVLGTPKAISEGAVKLL
jgi:CPA2 family monovalent cation:H+ antiporter-2